MNEKRTTPGSGRRSKRTAPTIDLAATEVQPVASEQGESAPEPSKTESSKTEPSKIESLKPEPAAAASAGQTPPQESKQESEQEPKRESEHADPANDAWVSIGRYVTAPVLVAGFAGAVATTLVLFALWLTGLLPIRYAGSTATRARVAALEMEMTALQNRPAPAPDAKVVAALTERVNAMQDVIAKLPAGGPAQDPALAERVAAADNAMKSLGLALAALNKRSDDIAGSATQARERAETAEKAVTELRGNVQDVSKTAASGASSTDIDALQKRIAALEQSAQAARDAIAKTGASDAAARLALSAAALRDAAASGAPYAALLAQAKALGADASLLAALEPFAADGVPSAASLAQELRAVLPGMIKATEPAPGGGFLEKLQANASNLVRVRPVGAPAGDDSAAVLARVDRAVANADIGAALAELAKLPEATHAPAQAWIAKANARQSALSAARTLVTETARTLGSK